MPVLAKCIHFNVFGTRQTGALFNSSFSNNFTYDNEVLWSVSPATVGISIFSTSASAETQQQINVNLYVKFLYLFVYVIAVFIATAERI